MLQRSTLHVFTSSAALSFSKIPAARKTSDHASSSLCFLYQLQPVSSLRDPGRMRYRPRVIWLVRRERVRFRACLHGETALPGSDEPKTTDCAS